MTLTLFFIPDTEKFLNLVERSQGDIILHLPDGSRLDLKENQIAKQFLRFMHLRESGLRISLSDSMDTRAFLQYMMEAGAGH